MTHTLADEADMIEESRRSAQERLRDAEEQGLLDISGHTFRFRDEMEAHLRITHRSRVGRSLTSSEVGMVKCVAIALWGAHAREHGVNVKIITDEHHQLVTKAKAHKDAVAQAPTVRQLRRELDALLPGQCTHPTSDRALERRRY